MAVDSLYPDRGKFYHKTYPISKQQLAKFFKIVNADRRKNLDKKVKKKYYETVYVNGEKEKHYPGGIGSFNFVTNNCKLYTLNIMHEIGIVDKSLNFIFAPPSIPKITKEMSKLKFKLDEKTRSAVWLSKFKVSKLPSLRYSAKFTEEEKDEFIENERIKVLKRAMSKTISILKEEVKKNNNNDLSSFLANVKKTQSEYNEKISEYNTNLVEFKKSSLYKNMSASKRKNELKEIKKNRVSATLIYLEEMKLNIDEFKLSKTFKKGDLKRVIIDTFKSILKIFGINLKKDYRTRLSKISKKIDRAHSSKKNFNLKR